MTNMPETEYHFYKIAPTEDLASGERMLFELEGNPIVLFRLGEAYYATGDVCTHDSGPISEGEIIDDEIICPRHGARFNLKTGKVLSFPAVEDIPVYPVRILDGFIEVGIMKQ
jgi:3-phenylpropionate/trans-cinnamate dioxygenase ferredoxin subunit